MVFSKEHFSAVMECPWCGSTQFKYLYTNKYDAKALRCCECGLAFSDKILNEIGRQAYWENYLSQVQCNDDALCVQREKMYRLEFNYIKRYICVKNSMILDVGCGQGDFLDYYDAEGGICHGVEFGKEAANIASKKYKIFEGVFPDINITEKYDLIIFRGTIQYFIHPKQYVKKAMELLNNGGILYITSSPNADSFCFNLFKENFTLPVSITDYYAFNEKTLTDYIRQLGGKLLSEYHFYTETPYADIETDIGKVAKAISLEKEGKKIDFKSPAFYDNMLTLVYQKVKDDD